MTLAAIEVPRSTAQATRYVCGTLRAAVGVEMSVTPE
jgi:hypothetical protein